MKPTHILIVDDQPINTAVIEKILSQEEGVRITPVFNGNQALELIKSDPADLILLDILMPGMDGFELCAKIKSDPAASSIPVIFITSLDDPESIERAFDSGGIDYISKPFNPREVRSRVRAHIGLKMSSDRLAALSAWKDRLLSILSHDMRGPFGNLVMYSDLMEKELGEISPFFSDRYKKIKKSIASISDLMENLLEWSVNQSGGAAVRPEKFDLAEIIAECIKFYGSYAHDKNITLASRISRGTNITADRRITEIILRNLVRNAIKFTASGGVEIDAYTSGGLVNITVSDSGVGIEPGAMSLILDSHQAFSTSGTMKERGSGVGLMICKDLASVCGGKISADSATGTGSKFTFTFPEFNDDERKV